MDAQDGQDIQENQESSILIILSIHVNPAYTPKE